MSAWILGWADSARVGFVPRRRTMQVELSAVIGSLNTLYFAGGNQSSPDKAVKGATSEAIHRPPLRRNGRCLN